MEAKGQKGKCREGERERMRETVIMKSTAREGVTREGLEARGKRRKCREGERETVIMGSIINS